MAGESKITVVGNLVADPELRKTQSGVSVVGVTVASTPRTFDKNANEWKDGEALFLRLNIWRELGEHVASSLTKGSRVIVTGSLVQRGFEDKDGNKRSSYEIEVDEIGPSLRYATASVQKSPSGQTAQQPARARQDEWAPSAPSAYADETPF